jgi:Bacterial Ig-like domain (group 3)
VVGTYSVEAEFLGSTDYSSAVSVLITFKIRAISAHMTLASSGGSAVYWQPVTFVTTVTATLPAVGTPTGSVTFFDNAQALATIMLDSLGRAALTTSVLAVGSHSITASYYGSAHFVVAFC